VIPERFQRVLAELGDLPARFEASGFRLYLVGGVVRDLFARPDALEGADVDLTTDATPEQVLRLAEGWAEAVWEQGRSYGTVGLARAGRRFEVTTHRAEVYVESSRKPVVRFGTSLEEDLARRDFTVNAMAIDAVRPRLVDPFGGMQDLLDRRLTTPLPAHQAFSEDPLRMLRAARFSAGFGLTPTGDVLEAIPALADRLVIVSPERIRDELDKLLVVEDPSDGLWLVVRTGLAEIFLPELPALQLEQDPLQRHKDVLAHTVAVVAKTGQDRLLRLAALLHDIGKPKTRAFGPEGVSFHHHDVVGARMARDRMRALRYPEEDVAVVSGLVELHLRFHTYQLGWTDRAVRRYVRDAGPLLERLNELTRCDCTTRNAARARALSRRMDELEARIAELEAQEELRQIRPDLDGREVMALLGIQPGPEVGAALDYLLELRLDEGPLGKELAAERLETWWAARRDAAPSD